MHHAGRRAILAGLGASVAISGGLGRAFAQTWPAKPVRLIVPTGVGSATDLMARLMANEVGAAIGGFVGALQPGAPFAATFMAGSSGYAVGGTDFPALRVTPSDVTEHFTRLGASQLSVRLARTPPLVRPK